MVKHDFKVKTEWLGGREEVGKLRGDIINENISIPSSLGGQGKGTNPDELLVSAASSCYIISLAATLEKSGFTNVKINQQSIGTASFENKKFKMERITHYPSIKVPSSQTEKLKSILDKLLVIADNNCMISNAIRNNVIISIEPNLI